MSSLGKFMVAVFALMVFVTGTLFQSMSYGKQHPLNDTKIGTLSDSCELPRTAISACPDQEQHNPLPNQHCKQHCDHVHTGIVVKPEVVTPKQDSFKASPIHRRIPQSVFLETNTRPPNL